MPIGLTIWKCVKLHFLCSQWSNSCHSICCDKFTCYMGCFNHLEIFLVFLQKSEFQLFGRHFTIWTRSTVSCKIVSISGFFCLLLLVCCHIILFLVISFWNFHQLDAWSSLKITFHFLIIIFYLLLAILS